PAAGKVFVKIHADVTAGELHGRRIVERATDNGGARRQAGRAAMRVGQQWLVVSARSERRRRMAKAVGIAAAPAVVTGRDRLVDLLPGILTHVVDQNLAGAGLYGKRERIAQPEHVDELVDAGRRAHERIVAGNQMAYRGVVPCGDTAVEFRHIDSQLLAEQA